MSANDIRPGDAVFFRYGWSSLWTQPQAYNNNPPGIGVAVARWVAERRVTMIGSDSWGSEVLPNPQADQVFPVHQELMMKNGILNLENMRFDDLVADRVNEFLFILTPIRFKGATGSPVRPIAIR
jgi:kynurenine formamidase